MKPSLKVDKNGELSMSAKAMGKLLQAALSKGASIRFKARGYSMSPFIKDGDIITVSPFSSALRPGQVVAFLHPESRKLIVHRIIRKRGDFYYIKGDKRLEFDGKIPQKGILGKVTGVEREGKIVSMGLGLGGGFIAFFSANRPVYFILLFIKKMMNIFKFKNINNG